MLTDGGRTPGAATCPEAVTGGTAHGARSPSTPPGVGPRGRAEGLASGHKATWLMPLFHGPWAMTVLILAGAPKPRWQPPKVLGTCFW